MIDVARACAAPVCLALALAVFVPAAAAAQQRSPYSDLFGRPVPRSGREFTSIHVRGAAVTQRGWTLEQEFLPPGTVVPEGIAAGADASLLAQIIRDKAQVIGQARYSYQEYRQDPPFGTPAIDAAVRVDLRPRTRLGFQGGASFTRSPFYQLMWLPADPSTPFAPADQAAILMLENDTTEYSAGVNSRYTRRSTIELTGMYRSTDYVLSPQHDFSVVGGAARWGHQLTRDLAFHAGFGREQATQVLSSGQQSLITNDRLDVGFDYGRALSLARRTSFGFATSTSMLRENNSPYRFRLNGDVTLNHRFLRTWQVQLSARRGSDFLPGLQGVVLSDQAMARLAGYLSKRLLLNVSADGSRGEAGLNDHSKFTTYTGSTRLTFALTRHFGVFGQYAYYHYQVPADPLLPVFIPRAARQAVSVGVETWVPIFDKEKVNRDSR